MAVVVRCVLIVSIDHKTDHSAVSSHNSGVEDISSLLGCSALSGGKQFNDFLMVLHPSAYWSVFTS
jgi:hypothetical protein